MGARLGFEELAKKVVERGACAGCGSCVIVCPYQGVLEFSDGKPEIVGECKDCGICTRVCSRYSFQTDELEASIFGRVRKPEEDFGIYREIHVARSTDDEFLKQCQDGGVATALITAALDSGLIDGAIIAGIDPSVPWLPIPFISTKKDDAIRYAGTRYTFSPNLLALTRCESEGLKRVAFVGVPCQILAFRMIQKMPLKKLSDIVAFTIGLFCSESFTYDGLMVKKIQNEMGMNLRDIEKINIKGKMIITLKDGKRAEIPLKETRTYAERKCRYCSDFSAELADVSLGGVGLDGRTLTLIRTKQGEKLFSQALNGKNFEVKPMEEFARAYDLLVQLSKVKHRNVQNIV
ncbi:MAG: Coenzyme F420 hydrogenase/dehydrogenase, beta subunit C-terminal domain [Candidatus Bathyarchaeota archaeon]